MAEEIFPQTRKRIKRNRSKRNLIGQRFHRWTVLDHAKQEYGPKLWKCRCDCGTIRDVLERSLITLHSQSCGCYCLERNVESKRKHGMCGTKTYWSWRGMISRCNPNSTLKNRRWYVDSGITVCERWISSFTSFLADMGKCPDGYSLDRINPRGNYEKSNCRWIPFREQARNTRRNVRLTYNGDTKLLLDWAKELGIRYDTLAMRLWRGWSVEKTLTEPLRYIIHAKENRTDN